MPDTSVAGLTPEQWETRLDSVRDDPAKLAEALGELEQEMRQENTWVHENPTPGPVFKAIFRFFNRQDDDLESLGKQIHTELHAELRLKERYRGWLPGEEAADRLFPYLKDFGGEVHPDPEGIQFPGFLKYKGIKCHSKCEVFAFYLNERFPGRDPANFHLSFSPTDGVLVIARIYKMELPRLRCRSAARAVAVELINDIAPDLTAIKELVVDNAANVETREAMLRVTRTEDETLYELKSRAVPAKTPLGHMLLELAKQLGLTPGEFQASANRFGVLKIRLPVS